MTLKNIKNFVLAEAGAEGGTGGGGTALTGSGKTGGNPNPGAGATGSGFTLPDKWQSQLPEDLRGEPSIQHFTDFPTLIKSFVNAQKTIGAERIAIPGKTATDEDWMNNVYKKLGLPDSKEKYELKPNEALLAEKDFVDKFKETALAAGVLPKQGQKLLDLVGLALKDTTTKGQAFVKSEQEKDIKNLQTEWGKAYDVKVKQAMNALDRFGDDNLKKLLDVTGLGNNSAIIKAFAKMGESLTEDGIVGGSGGGGEVYSPEVAKQKYGAIISDANHAYNVKDHPNHTAAVAEVAGLFAMAFPQS
jgi:hypothetical protein